MKARPGPGADDIGVVLRCVMLVADARANVIEGNGGDTRRETSAMIKDVLAGRVAGRAAPRRRRDDLGS